MPPAPAAANASACAREVTRAKSSHCCANACQCVRLFADLALYLFARLPACLPACLLLARARAF
eukprot:4259156-Alexandrium_andersonii.AAC.1